MTVQEYLEKEGITAFALSKKIKVTPPTVYKVIQGGEIKVETACKFARLGIEVAVIGNKIPTVEMIEDNSCHLKYFQIAAIQKLGNTIVSKEYSPESIIKAFKRFGVDVEVKNFSSREVIGEDTYLVIKKEMKLGGNVK